MKVNEWVESVQKSVISVSEVAVLFGCAEKDVIEMIKDRRLAGMVINEAKGIGLVFRKPLEALLNCEEATFEPEEPFNLPKSKLVRKMVRDWMATLHTKWVANQLKEGVIEGRLLNLEWCRQNLGIGYPLLKRITGKVNRTNRVKTSLEGGYYRYWCSLVVFDYYLVFSSDWTDKHFELVEKVIKDSKDWIK